MILIETGRYENTSPSPQVPYEVLNKKFRAAQKVLDREGAYVTQAGVEIEKLLSVPVPKAGADDGGAGGEKAERATGREVSKLLGVLVDRLTSLKRKVGPQLRLRCQVH